ncbi:MAG: response regulator [Chitinispirillaceae bacterium]|nr:response regulator [Chitinispirillaceae bacterium]
MEFVVPEPVWRCRYDSAQFEQVMQNLTQNALQAMPEGGTIIIKITNCRINGDCVKNITQGNYVQVSVSDTGTGISDDIRQHVFDPFFTTRELGRGLGLTTSYSIISRHGGTIEVESNSPKGFAFHVYLPVINEEEDNDKNEGSQETSGKVLLMDDEDVVLQTTAQLLKKLGFQVTVVRNGEEAMKEFVSAKKTGVTFNIVILDLAIYYGWGGIRTLEEIRKLDSEIPVIVASGYANDAVIVKPEQFGFSYSIRKPFTMLELSELLKKMPKKRARN